ncbi:uncharacterized protein HGUI_00684 [Hanseniaspora guilliermondii]|uniref:RRM domain-containing protein n=1 Tax=Hanseniaspora guilliermondii TaxID=56406 RepID=A0A1L0AY62_9ASCO|nr:uncharacterized protein HGUI_00684 [Hanseniaspora guilliermondii]
MSLENNTEVPLPPSTTALNSSLTGEAPRTLWMGDLNPLYNEKTIIDIFAEKGFKVNTKMIKNRKGVLIPCSNKITYDQMQMDKSKSPSPDYLSTNKMININGMKFVDPHSTTLHHSGYCFVEFDSYDEAIKALKLNTQLIPNIKYHPDESEVEHINTFMDQNPIDILTSFHTNPDNNRTFRLSWAASTSLNAPSIQTPEYSMFIGDISKSTTETDLMIFFQKTFKTINSVRIMTDPLSGQSRCFGFIRFGNIKDRDNCITQYNNKEVCGAIVRCALAAARNNSKQNIINNTSHDESGSHANHHKRSRSYHGRNSNDLKGRYQFNHRKSNSLSSVENKTFEKPNYSIFIGNLNKNLDDVEFFRLLQQAGTILSINSFPSKRSALVGFTTSEAAEWAINNFNGKFLSSTGLPMTVEWTYGNEPMNQYNAEQNYRNNTNEMTSRPFNMNEGPYCGRHLSYSSDSSAEMQNNGFGNNYDNNYMLNNNIANSYSLQNGYTFNNNFNNSMFNNQIPNPRAATLLRNMSGSNTTPSKISPANSYYGQNSVYETNNMVGENNIWKS